MNKKPPLSAFFSLTLLSMLSFTLLPVIAADALSWNIQTVDEYGAAMGNGYCPIAVDSNNTVHIAYTAWSEGFEFSVMHARGNGAGFSTERISEGFAYSLVLDAEGNPHILYGGLMYASWTGSEWNIQTVDPNFGGSFGLIALDSYGNPHVAYTNGKTIKYAVSNGEKWNIQTVAQYDDVEIPPKLSFVLDKNDTPYILYSPSSYVYFPQDVGIQAINVTLATYKDDSWKFQPLSLPTPTDDYGNMVVDSKGDLHSIFIQNYISSGNTIRTLLYGSWNGTGWDTQQVFPNIRLPYSVSLALDSRDYPHIICSNGVYASWTGTAWDVQSTDVSGYLTVDADGNLHVSWTSSGGSWFIANLTYATATPPTPTPTATPTHEPQSTEQEIIIGVALVLAVIALGLGLLLYLLKK